MLTATQIGGFAGPGLAGAAYLPQVSHLVRARCSAGISRLAFGGMAAGAGADHGALKQAGNPAEIPFPPALLRRAARYISGAADLAANGGKLPDGIPETARNQLAATLRRDADGLIAITTTD